MLGQDALCPFCGVQFRLRWEDTREYRREKELEMERRLARQSKQWLQWSIAAAVVVIVALIIMIAIAASH
jgi:cytoskeletal protein RodZ